MWSEPKNYEMYKDNFDKLEELKPGFKAMCAKNLLHKQKQAEFKELEEAKAIARAEVLAKREAKAKEQVLKNDCQDFKLKNAKLVKMMM